MKIIRKEKKTLNPEWMARTAKLAMKRGTSIVFAANGCVYGILPKSGGSVNVFYDADKEWVDTVLSMFPKGACFPFDNAFGGANAAKALRAYANVRLPEDGTGTAWIDPLTHALHVKGKGTTIHSATFESNEMPSPQAPQGILEFSLGEHVSKDIGKLLIEFTKRDDNRPTLRRVYAFLADDGGWLGSTDSKSAIMHKVPSLPEMFSFDPSLVNMFDITGYVREINDAGATFHTFRLSDGTTFVEKISAAERPNLLRVVMHNASRESVTLMAAAPLRKLEEDITALGLGANDSFGGVLTFSSVGVAMMSGGQPVAEFDASVELPPGDEVRFSLPIVSRFAKLGGDFTMTADGEVSVGICRTQSTIVVAGQMTIPKPADAATAQ